MHGKVALCCIAVTALSLLLLGQGWRTFGQTGLTDILAEPTEEVMEMTGQGEDEVSWTLTADRIVAQHDSEYVQAFGDATLKKGDNTLRADFIRYYRATQWVVLKGGVRAVWQGDFLEAEEAEFNLMEQVGWLKNGRAFVAKPHLFFEYDYIRKYAGDSYQFKNAKVTACSGAKPDWSFTAAEGDIDLDGTARLWHSTFRIKDTPVAWLPYAQVPAGGKRTSGFLMPEVGFSDNLGFTLNLPYYWAIDEEHDATFYQKYMSDRGYMQGLEFRHTEDVHTQGLWRFDYLDDNKVVNTAAKDTDYPGDGLLRPNHERWWLRSKYDGYVHDPAWKVILDLDLVSDQDYLREFRSGYNGYYASDEEFVERFGRDIAPLDAQNRTSTAFLSRSWDRFGLTAKLEYTQNLAYWNNNNRGQDDPTVQKLPELSFFAFKDSIPGTPLDFQGRATYDYFWREEGTKGHRLDVEPEVSLALETDYLTVIPRAGMRYTQYAVDSYGNEPAVVDTNDKTPSRTLMTAGLSAFSELERVYELNPPLAPTEQQVGLTRWAKMKHSVIPRVDYSWVQTAGRQSRLPEFDEFDRIKPKNEITYSLTNVLDRKRETVALGPDGETPTIVHDYLDFVRVRLQQSYDRNEAGRDDQTDVYERRPFSDILAEFIVKPREYVSLESRSWFSPYENAFTRHEHLLRLFKEGLGDVYFGYDYQERIMEYDRRVDEAVQVLELGGNLWLTDKLLVGLDFRTDIEASKDLERSIHLRWVDDCWSMRAYYSNTDTDNEFGLRFDLFEF